MQHGGDAVLETHKLEQMYGQPKQPAGDTGQADPANLRYGAKARDDRHVPAVPILEGLTSRLAVKPAHDLPGCVLSTWIATCATPGSRSSAMKVTDHENLRKPGNGAVGFDLDP